MAGRLAACRFVGDRCDHSQVAPAIAPTEDADAARDAHLLARNRAAGFPRGRRKNQTARAVEHADAVDALLAPDGLHHFVRRLAVVVQHGVPGGAGDAFGKLVRARDHGVQQVLLLAFHRDQPGNGANHNDNERQREDQFLRESPRQANRTFNSIISESGAGFLACLLPNAAAAPSIDKRKMKWETAMDVTLPADLRNQVEQELACGRSLRQLFNILRLSLKARAGAVGQDSSPAADAHVGPAGPGGPAQTWRSAPQPAAVPNKDRRVPASPRPTARRSSPRNT